MSKSDTAVIEPAEVAGAAGQPGTALAPAPARPTPKVLPPYKVLLHNDDVNEFLFVVRAIVQLTPLDADEALQKTIEAHETGVSLLLVTNKERAELYVEQFASLKLTATTEPD